MTLKVLQLGPFPPPEGGVSRNVLAIRDALIDAGHDAFIIATTRGDSEELSPFVFRPTTFLALVRLLRSLKYDILHLHVGGDISPRVLALALTVNFFGRGAAVLTLHSGAFPKSQAAANASQRSITGSIFRRFSRIIAVNEAIADVFHRFGVDRSKVRVISPFSPQEPDDAVQVPSELAAFYQTHCPVLLSVGGLEPDYDPIFQISAMRNILNYFPNAGLLMVGDGTLRNDAERAVALYGLQDKIKIAGNVEHSVTLHLIKDAGVVLRTTLFDGDAISVREALHFGTPVIATNCVPRPAGVHRIDPSDTAGLVRAVRELIGKERIPFKQPDNVQKVLEMYREVATA